MVYTKKIKDVANQLMLSFHYISHSCQLSTSSSMEKNNKSLKNLFQFLEKLFKCHHNSAVVTVVFRETVKVLDITGATSVIWVNETHWISHVQLALKTLLDAYNAHVQTYNKCNKLKNIHLFQNCNLFIFLVSWVTQFMEFAIFMLDVVNPLSIFSKVSQDRNISCTSVNNSFQKCLVTLAEFYDDRNCGENWKKGVVC